MKLTTESHKSMSYFIKENMPQIKQTHKTDTFFSSIKITVTLKMILLKTSYSF